MLYGVAHRISRTRVRIKQLTDEVFCLFRYDGYVILEGEVSGQNLLEHLILIDTVEWELSVEHSVEDHSRAPCVDLCSIVCLVLEDLRRSVVWRSTGSSQARPVLHHVAQAEVADLEILIGVKQ